MDTAHYRNRAFEEHVQKLDILRRDQVQKVVKLLRAHVERTKEFQSRASWSTGHSSRRIYRARDYGNILAGD